MKKLNLLFIGILSMSTVYAQEISDVLRYSQSEIHGTARFRAMSGAFGALGGDLSAVSLNPAGSVVFNQSHAAITGSVVGTDNTTEYFNNYTNSNESKFQINQGGAAFIFRNNDRSSEWSKFALSFNYERTNNHNSSWTARGLNDTQDPDFSNSVASYFFDYADGKRLVDISALPDETISQAYRNIGDEFGFAHQQGFLGYESYILDPEFDDDENTAYFSNVEPGNFNHNYTYIASGYSSKMSFNLATQYKNVLSLGLNLNSHFMRYDRATILLEDNNNVGSYVNSIDFRNNLTSRAAGFSFQLGAIVKLTPELRAGLTYDSPTWYSVDEETSQSVSTVRDEVNGPESILIAPGILNVYPRYNLQSPSRFTGSLAYVFAKRGILSFNYSNTNYSKTKLTPTYDPFFADQNDIMSNTFTNASTYRIGAEYKIKQISLRGGYRFEESPYLNQTTVGDLTGYSFGIGFNFGNFRLDLAYDRAERDSQNNLYNLNFGTAPSANVNTENQNFTFTLAFNI
ncbi:OmpP1/FadL family transporter [uncultured Algibacter sp.]|uniref:OmpP1/FadL family transporter n=1 Tax=uncultured Algibacter sp. TaxID=298659 RepID=UPI00260C40BE|nr:outer membrane protein transport protein [uncultured Algibacter sp.]